MHGLTMQTYDPSILGLDVVYHAGVIGASVRVRPGQIFFPGSFYVGCSIRSSSGVVDFAPQRFTRPSLVESDYLAAFAAPNLSGTVVVKVWNDYPGPTAAVLAEDQIEGSVLNSNETYGPISGVSKSIQETGDFLNDFKPLILIAVGAVAIGALRT